MVKCRKVREKLKENQVRGKNKCTHTERERWRKDKTKDVEGQACWIDIKRSMSKSLKGR